MVTYICPNCGQREIIGLEVNVVIGEGKSKRKCENCGSEMKEE